MHEALDPEYSILKQRLARRIRHDGLTDEDIAKMDLVQITKVQSVVACYLLPCRAEANPLNLSKQRPPAWKEDFPPAKFSR